MRVRLGVRTRKARRLKTRELRTRTHYEVGSGSVTTIELVCCISLLLETEIGIDMSYGMLIRLG